MLACSICCLVFGYTRLGAFQDWSRAVDERLLTSLSLLLLARLSGDLRLRLRRQQIIQEDLCA